MQIAFDPAKDTAYIAKHGVSLTFAAQIMADPNRVEILDLRFDYGEDRWAVFGMVENRVWVCIHTPRGETRRIISVRKANDRETNQYLRTRI